MQTIEELKAELKMFQKKLKEPIGLPRALQYSKWIEEIEAEIRMAEREGMTA